MKRLALEGWLRVVATSAQRNELQPILDSAGIADCIDAAATSDDARRSKPNEDIVIAALKKAGVARDRAVMLGDTPYDVEAAHRAGVAAIAVRCSGWNDRALAGAAAIYDDPADLLAHFNVSLLGKKLRYDRT